MGVSVTGLMLAGSALSPALAATIDLAGSNLTVPGLSGNNIYTNSGAPANLTINATGTTAFNGNINNAGGAITVVKSGLGRQDFNRANTYTGGTDLQSGTFGYGDNASFGTGLITVSGASTLRALNIGRVLSNGIVLNAELTASGNTTYAGLISGSGAIVKEGTNILRLSNAVNTFTGGITLNNGGVYVGGNGSLGTGALTVGLDNSILGVVGDISVVLQNAVVLNRQLNVELPSAGNSITLNGAISGAGNLFLKSGGGTLILPNATTYTGTTLIASGVLGVGNSLALGNGASIVTASAPSTIAAYANNLNLANEIRSRTALTIDTRGFDMTLSGLIRNAAIGTLALTKVGAGTLTLSGASIYTGATNLNAGAIDLTGTLTSDVNVASGTTFSGTGSTTGAVTISDGATLTPGGAGTGIGTLSFGSLTLGSSSLLNFDLGTPNVVGGPDNDLIIVSGNLNLGGSLNILGGGSFGIGTYRLINYTGILGGSSLALGAVPGGFLYSVDTTIAGQVNLLVSALAPPLVNYWDGNGAPNDNAVAGGNGTWNAANINWTDVGGTANTVWPNTSATTGIFGVVGGTVGVVGAQNFGTLIFNVGGYVLTGAGTLVTSGAAVIDTATGASDVTVLDLAVTGAGSIVKQGVGYLDFVRANSYAGGTDVQAGTVRAYVSGALGAGDVTMANGTRVDLVTGGIVLANNFVLSGSSTVGVYSGSSSIDGVVSGTGTLIKSDGGELLLNNAANSYSGGTNVVQGTLALGADAAAGTGAITLQDGTILSAAVSGLVVTNEVVTIANGRVNSGPGVFTLNGDIGGAGSISQIGTGNLVLNGNNSFVNLGINQGTVTVGTNTAAGLGFIAINDNATLAAGVSGLVLENDIETTANGLVDSGAGVFTLNGDIGGAGSISQIGTGNLVLNGNNFFNNLGINQGTVTVGTNTAAGLGFIAINDNATLAAGVSGLVLANDIETTANGLVNSGPGVFTLNGDIGGAGSISQIGTGNLVLNGNNSFTNLGINQGTVTVGTNTAAGAGFIAINNDATLAAGVSGLVLANDIETTANGLVNSGPGVFTLNGVIGGAGSISQIGTGNLVLNGNNGFNNLGINQGTVTVGSNTAAGIGFIAINNNATLAAGANNLVLANDIETTANGLVNAGGAGNVFTLNGDIGGAGSISQIGLGTLVLNGNNSFNNLGINQGTVVVGTNTAAGAGFIAINDNATLAAGVSGLVIENDIETTANGLVDSGPGVFTLNGVIAGAGSISQIGTGNLVLNGNNSFVNLGINQGTVTVGTNTAAGIGLIAINNNATLAAGVSGLALENDIETTGNGMF
nr:autotransporter-associated beta strand repeat-containing protein [Polymorphobacter sp.]